ncbi:unnamed protein product, partial [Meganyctiphanes norvegica]
MDYISRSKKLQGLISIYIKPLVVIVTLSTRIIVPGRLLISGMSWAAKTFVRHKVCKLCCNEKLIIIFAGTGPYRPMLITVQCVTTLIHKSCCKVKLTLSEPAKDHWSTKGPNIQFYYLRFKKPYKTAALKRIYQISPAVFVNRCPNHHYSSHMMRVNYISELAINDKLRGLLYLPNYSHFGTKMIEKKFSFSFMTALYTGIWLPPFILGHGSCNHSKGNRILKNLKLVKSTVTIQILIKFVTLAALKWFLTSVCSLISNEMCCIEMVSARTDMASAWRYLSIYKKKVQGSNFYISILLLGEGCSWNSIVKKKKLHICHFDAKMYCKRHAYKPILPTKKPMFEDSQLFFKRSLRSPTREVKMNNYVSFGVDALVTLNFHKARQSPFYIFSNRTINKLLYFSFGTKDVLEHECKDLDQKLELFMDDRRKTLPNIESVVILNIASWGAGIRPWTLGPGGPTAPKQDFSDGLLEVFCITSSFHIAQMHVGLSEPIRLGQCSSVKIRLKGTSPMQVDGEPWEQTPGDITITHSHKAAVLLNQ